MLAAAPFVLAKVFRLVKGAGKMPSKKSPLKSDLVEEAKDELK
jgi:hypothetical protein